MADNYLQDMMARIVAMQKEALASLISGGIDSVPYWPYSQEAPPYCYNRLGPMITELDTISEETDIYRRTIYMRLVVDHYSAGFQGDKPDLAYQYLVLMETYFREHPELTTDASTYGAYTAVPNYIGYYEAELQGDSGLIIFSNAGIFTNQFGIEFTLVVPYLREVY